MTHEQLAEMFCQRMQESMLDALRVLPIDVLSQMLKYGVEKADEEGDTPAIRYAITNITHVILEKNAARAMN